MNDNETAYNTIEEILDKGYDVLNEWLSKKETPQPRQSWSLINSSRLAKIWRDYSRLGVVRDEKAILAFQGTIVENVGKLYANTIFMGHDRIHPCEHAESLGFEDITDNHFDGFEDFITDNRGSWRISDYAIEKLVNATIALAKAGTMEEKLLAIDHILNIVHQRSDLSSWFIEGGTTTLNNLRYN